MDSWINDKFDLRIIKTARTIKEINAAAAAGMIPLVKAVERNPKISSNYALLQHKINKTIKVIGDVRDHDYKYPESSDYELVVDFKRYYPHTFPPFAAYLLPAD